MKARMQSMMVKLNDPRTLRVVLIGIALALAAVAQATPAGVEAVYACPAMGGGGCTGG